MRRRRSWVTALVGALTAVLALAGCATHEGGTPGALARAAEEAASAASSAETVVLLGDRGRATTALVDTTLADALADLRAAEVAVAGRQVAKPSDAEAQARVLAAIDDARAALVAARAWATGAGGAPEVLAGDLGAAADALSAVADEIGPA